MSEDAAPKKKSKPKRDAAGNDVPKKKSKPKRDAAIEDAPALSAVDAPKAKKKKKNQEEGQGDPVAAETETVPKKKSKKRDAQEAPVDMETETLANEERGDGNIAAADVGKPARVRKRKRPKPAPAAANSEPVQAGADSQPELGRQTHARAPTSRCSRRCAVDCRAIERARAVRGLWRRDFPGGREKRATGDYSFVEIRAPYSFVRRVKTAAAPSRPRFTSKASHTMPKRMTCRSVPALYSANS